MRTVVEPVEIKPGLRERKKQWTREQLIDAAVELCLKQGYENTTVDQIAAAADVSTRTFSRYFPTKDAVVMSLLDKLNDVAAEELAALPPEVGPLEAMCRAHVTVLNRIEAGQVRGLTSEAIGMMLRIVTSTPALTNEAAQSRPEPFPALIAARMGVDVTDRRLHLALATWAAIATTASAVGEDEVAELGAGWLAQRWSTTFDQFRELAIDLVRPVAVQ